MVTSVPDALQPAIEQITETENYEDMSAAVAEHFVPLSNIVYTQAVSFISVILEAEGQTDEEGSTVWEHEDGGTLILSKYAMIPEGGWPDRVIYTLLGYAYSHDIPFLGFGAWGNLAPEFSFKAKSQEKQERIAAIFARAEANLNNTDILNDCVEELHLLDAPPPPPGSPLAKALTEYMEPDLRETRRN